MTAPKCIIDMMETRIIYEQLGLKLCINLKTGSTKIYWFLLIKKRVFVPIVLRFNSSYQISDYQNNFLKPDFVQMERRLSYLFAMVFPFWRNISTRQN